MVAAAGVGAALAGVALAVGPTRPGTGPVRSDQATQAAASAPSAPVTGVGGPTSPGAPLAQVRGTAADPNFPAWCGSARGVPALQPAVGYVIRWDDPVSAENLPRVSYGKDVAPDIQGYSEYGDYVIPGATGQEEWTEAVIYCLDETGTPISNLPAVLDRAELDP